MSLVPRLRVAPFSPSTTLVSRKCYRTYKRKTDQGTTVQAVFQQAAADVESGNSSLRVAAEDYGINFMTLQRYCKRSKKADTQAKEPNTSISVGYKNPKQVFSDEQERELVNYILHSSKIYFGLSTREVRCLAYQYEEANEVTMHISLLAVEGSS